MIQEFKNTRHKSMHTSFKMYDKLSDLEKFRKSYRLSLANMLILKGNIKGLAVEARRLRWISHKLDIRLDLSNCIRMHLLAYAFLRNKPYKTIERSCHDRIYASQIFKIIKENTYQFITEEAVKEWLYE